jgi:hypothetical protein
MIRLVGFSISGIPAGWVKVESKRKKKKRKNSTWTAFWTEIAQDDDGFFALWDRPGFHGFDERIFRVKRASAACESESFLSSDLCYRTSRC